MTMAAIRVGRLTDPTSRDCWTIGTSPKISHRDMERRRLVSDHDPEEGLANAPHQDADCARVIGVNICSSWRDRVTVEPNKRRMTPWEKSKSIHMRGSCWKRTDLEPLLKPLRMLSNSNQKGETELAKTWRHIEDAMKLMRGPHQS